MIARVRASLVWGGILKSGLATPRIWRSVCGGSLVKIEAELG